MQSAMENYNDVVETEVLPLPATTEVTPSSCCYKRPSAFMTEFLPNESRTFPDHGGATILDPTPPPVLTTTSSRLDEEKFKDVDQNKYKVLLNYEDAPEHLQFNPYIRSGYRTFLPTKMCLKSAFWWTNETVNIWSHIFGWFLFVGLTINDLSFLSHHAAMTDKVIVGSLLVCFQVCMLLSSIYHIFSCRSAKDYDVFLSYDLFGIALSLLAIYISGVYYAFWCHETLRNFYTLTVVAIFMAAMIIQLPSLNVSPNAKICVFVAWAVYGFIPTLHWTIEMGGFQHPMVKLLVPRVLVMYLISGLAFLIYMAKIPERWFTGKLDYIGHSHNWWHFFVLLALYHWHNTGIVYAEFRMSNGCDVVRSTF